MKNILIKGTGLYIPPNKVYNEELDEHFEKSGLSAHSLINHLGRRKRYFISEGENAITMLQNAIDNCVEKNQLDLEDYEMLVVCTDTPEFCHQKRNENRGFIWRKNVECQKFHLK